MNTANMLRQELCTVTKEAFIDKVVDSIKRSGYYAMAYDNGEHTHLNNGFFSTADMNRCLKWAQIEGFNVERERTCYGQTTYFVTL